MAEECVSINKYFDIGKIGVGIAVILSTDLLSIDFSRDIDFDRLDARYSFKAAKPID